MPKVLRFSELAPNRQALVRLCQLVNYGFIERLHVRDSEPVLSPPPLVLQDLKLDSDEEPRPELGLTDFVLKDELCRLLARLERLQNGIVARVEIRAGVPRRLVLEARELSSEVTAG